MATTRKVCSRWDIPAHCKPCPQHYDHMSCPQIVGAGSLLASGCTDLRHTIRYKRRRSPIATVGSRRDMQTRCTPDARPYVHSQRLHKPGASGYGAGACVNRDRKSACIRSMMTSQQVCSRCDNNQQSTSLLHSEPHTPHHRIGLTFVQNACASWCRHHKSWNKNPSQTMLTADSPQDT